MSRSVEVIHRPGHFCEYQSPFFTFGLMGSNTVDFSNTNVN